MHKIFTQHQQIVKWIFAVLLTIFLLLFFGSWYLSNRLKPRLKQELKTLVYKSTQGLYQIEFSDVNANLISGNAFLKNVNIVPDTLVYRKLIAQKKAPNNLYYIKLKQVEIKSFHLLRVLLSRKIQIEVLLFDKPEVTLVNRHFSFNDDRPPRPLRSPYSYLSSMFKSLRVELVDFRNARLKYVNNNGAKPEVDSLNHLNVKLKDWLIDSLSAQDTSRIYLLKDIHLNFNNYRYATPDSMYFLNVSELDFTASTRILNVKKFELMPRHSEANFARVNGYARDRFHIQLNKISLGGINLPLALQQRVFKARLMRVSDGQVAVFNNNSYPSRISDKTGKFPHQLLQKMDQKLNIDQIQLKNIAVSYAEFDRDSKQKGKITFMRTSGFINNVTNITALKKINPMMQANLQSDFMGQGKLRVKFNFYLNSAVGAFDYKGSVQNLEGKKLNQITNPLGMVHVKRGMINRFDFDIKATQSSANGKIEFRYDNLSVALLRKQAGKDKLVKRGLLSVLANALLINTDNPTSSGKFTIAKVYYKRVPTASFFSFMWRTLFQGIKFSVGITPAKEAKIQQQVEWFEQLKKDRDNRKQRRELRKATKTEKK
jgi:hypothetical protein